MSNFIKSDYCTQCGGCGFRSEKTWRCPATGKEMVDYEQCESCEELHEKEIRADRLHDEMKGS